MRERRKRNKKHQELNALDVFPFSCAVSIQTASFLLPLLLLCFSFFAAVCTVHVVVAEPAEILFQFLWQILNYEFHAEVSLDF